MPKTIEIDEQKQERRKQAKENLENGKCNSMQERVEYIEQLLGI